MTFVGSSCKLLVQPLCNFCLSGLDSVVKYSGLILWTAYLRVCLSASNR